MMRYRGLSLMVALTLAFFTMGAVALAAKPDAGAEYVPGEILVKFAATAAPRRPLAPADTGLVSVNRLNRRFGVQRIEPVFTTLQPQNADDYGLNRVYKLVVPPQTDLDAMLAAYQADPNVEYAEPNIIFRALETDVFPGDTLFAQQWALNNTGQTGGTADADIDAPEAWNVITGSTGILIAVVDTGVDYTHPDLNDGRVRTDIDRDFVNNDNDARDDQGHGTHVAGIIAAAANGSGTVGILWQASILPVKVLSAQGSGSADQVAQGIQYAADQGARVINMSLGAPLCSQTIADAVNYAFEKGAVIVAAAGNDGGAVGYPAKHERVIAVAATDGKDRRATFSNRGPEVDVAAPGVAILSTVPNGGYESFSGTSMASPHVAGVAGLILAQTGTLTNAQVMAVLRNSADDLGMAGFDDDFGHGRVNAFNAVTLGSAAPITDTPPAICTSCVATTVLRGTEAAHSILSTLYSLRDHTLAQSPLGREYIRLYYRHSPELARLLLADPALRERVVRLLEQAARLLRNPERSRLDAGFVAEVEAVKNVLAARGSPALRGDMERVWVTVDLPRFVGSTPAQVWKATSSVWDTE